ncbi:MAG: hypothetical protein ABL931_18255, partial [Usitatibacteraceae bacterium]
MRQNRLSDFAPAAAAPQSICARFARLAAVIFVALVAAVPFSAHPADVEDAAKISALIAKFAKQLDVGTVSLNWNEQPEVKKLRALPDTRRTAAILATIWNLGTNDELIFNNKSNDYQVLVSMLTRIHAYTFLTRLTAASANDVVLKEYLEQEVTDLKQVFAR